jgi:hypothetical protein
MLDTTQRSIVRQAFIRTLEKHITNRISTMQFIGSMQHINVATKVIVDGNKITNLKIK